MQGAGLLSSGHARFTALVGCTAREILELFVHLVLGFMKQTCSAEQVINSRFVRASSMATFSRSQCMARRLNLYLITNIPSLYFTKAYRLPSEVCLLALPTFTFRGKNASK